jgi:hypothetical protein
MIWFNESLDTIKFYTEDRSGSIFSSFFPEILFRHQPETPALSRAGMNGCPKRSQFLTG